MRKLVALLLPALLCGPALAYTFEGPVTAVTGADTFEVLRHKKTEKVTLAGITVPAENEPAARKILFDKLLEKTVKVDVRDTDGDYKVADVTLKNGWNPATEFLKRGLAVTVDGPHATREMQKLQNEAKLARRGLWANGDVARSEVNTEPKSAQPQTETAAQPLREAKAAGQDYLGQAKSWWRDSVNSMRRNWHKFKNGN